MTKADMQDQIEFALSELADARIDLHRIQNMPLDQPRHGELWGETEARTIGRCQQMACNAEMFLGMAVGNLRRCLDDPNKPIPPLMATRNANERTSDPNPASQPNSNTKES